MGQESRHGLGPQGMELRQLWNGNGEGGREVEVHGVSGSNVVIESLEDVWSSHEILVDISGVCHFLLQWSQREN